MADKLRLRPSSAAVKRPYAPQKSESRAYSVGVASPPDLFEAFNAGPEDAARPGQVGRAMDGSAPNIWPEPDGSFEAVMSEFSSVEKLAHRLIAIGARALGLADDFFEPFTGHSTDLLRANHDSSAGGEEAEVGQLGMGAHSDHGILTILLGDQVSGLEILTAESEWRGVVPDDGALMVNLGELLARWTNDRWLDAPSRPAAAA